MSRPSQIGDEYLLTSSTGMVNFLDKPEKRCVTGRCMALVGSLIAVLGIIVLLIVLLPTHNSRTKWVLLVSNSRGGNVVAFDLAGKYLGNLFDTKANNSALANPDALHMGADGNLYISTSCLPFCRHRNWSSIVRMDKRGQHRHTFITNRRSPLQRPYDFQPLPHPITQLLNRQRDSAQLSGAGSSARTFNDVSGAGLDRDILADIGASAIPNTNDPDPGPGEGNDVLVCSYLTDQILRYNSSGGFVDVFAASTGEVHGVNGPVSMTYDVRWPNALFVTVEGSIGGSFARNFSTALLEFEFRTRQYVVLFQRPQPSSLADLAFGPRDGLLYVSDWTQNVVYAVDPKLGDLVNTLDLKAGPLDPKTYTADIEFASASAAAASKTSQWQPTLYVVQGHEDVSKGGQIHSFSFTVDSISGKIITKHTVLVPWNTAFKRPVGLTLVEVDQNFQFWP